MPYGDVGSNTVTIYLVNGGRFHLDEVTVLNTVIGLPEYVEVRVASGAEMRISAELVRTFNVTTNGVTTTYRRESAPSRISFGAGQYGWVRESPAPAGGSMSPHDAGSAGSFSHQPIEIP